METGQMKNIVVLKNLPSNVVEEAIVVLKPNQKVKQTLSSCKEVQKDKKQKNETETDYIIKEAQMVISDYISGLEREKNKKHMNGISQKYRRLKLITYLLGGIMFLNFVVNYIK